MIDRSHSLPITRQAEALGMARSTVYAFPTPVSERDLDLMKRMGIEALYRKPKTTKKHPQHRVYPYLLRGFVYLVAVLDWYSRKVLSWRVSITMDVHFCLEALEEAINVHGVPEIVNTDQGSQFTSLAFTGLLKKHGIRISMDGKGSLAQARNLPSGYHVFIERLWRSVKYEEVYYSQ
jgi:putative transposase